MTLLSILNTSDDRSMQSAGVYTSLVSAPLEVLLQCIAYIIVWILALYRTVSVNYLFTSILSIITVEFDLNESHGLRGSTAVPTRHTSTHTIKYACFSPPPTKLSFQTSIHTHTYMLTANPYKRKRRMTQWLISVSALPKIFIFPPRLSCRRRANCTAATAATTSSALRHERHIL